MRNWLVILSLALTAFSCSTDVDLYADYKDIPIIYGFLDADADTNYVKICRAFCGTNDNPVNALEVAPIYDSSNYPGKLDAYFVELKSTSGRPFQPTGRRFFLDTLTIHNKQDGLFYAPHQLLYYTNERFKTQEGLAKYRYRLYVIKPDLDTVTAETSLVGGDVGIHTSKVNFKAVPSHELSSIVFNSTEEAVLYEVGMRFSYWEGHSGQPMEKKSVEWNYTPKTIGGFEKVIGTDNYYRSYYSVNTLFNYLEHAIGNDTVWDENHPNVVRIIDNFDIFIVAAGEDLNVYYQYLQTMMNGMGISTQYTNVEGGFGILSSRIIVTHRAELSTGTKLDLFSKPWGFREQ